MATPDGPGGRWLSVRSSGTALPGTGAPAAGDVPADDDDPTRW